MLAIGIVTRPKIHVDYYNTLAAAHAIKPGEIGAAIALFQKAFTLGREAGAFFANSDALPAAEREQPGHECEEKS